MPNYSLPGELLFDYSDKPSASATDDQLEGADKDPTTTKVVDRRWYERNKHIFPASLWREYEPGVDFEDKMRTTRRDASGNTFFF